MKEFVLDASVVAKWIFQEEDSEKAEIFRQELKDEKIKIFVPEFLWLELANICWLKVKRKFSTVEKAIEGLDQILDSPLKFYPDRELADVALENALRFGVPAYDGLYLALAEVYFAPLVTADEKLFKICRGRFDFIESLKEVELS